MPYTAKLFRNGRSQAVRLPAQFRFSGSEVYVRRDPNTGDVILSRRPESWQDFFDLVEQPRYSERLPDEPTRHATAKAEPFLMSVRYLLDTNMASYVIKGNVPRVREKLLRVPITDVGISVMTEAELRFGVTRKPEAARLKLAVDEFLLRVDILLWDSSAAQQYAILRSALEDAGAPMGNMDMMIAAQALAAAVVLVTHDRVFQRVKQLKLEDWTIAR